MITLIVGTNRPGGNTRKMAAHLEEFYAGMKVPLRGLERVLENFMEMLGKACEKTGWRSTPMC